MELTLHDGDARINVLYFVDKLLKYFLRRYLKYGLQYGPYARLKAYLPLLKTVKALIYTLQSLIYALKSLIYAGKFLCSYFREFLYIHGAILLNYYFACKLRILVLISSPCILGGAV